MAMQALSQGNAYPYGSSNIFTNKTNLKLRNAGNTIFQTDRALTNMEPIATGNLNIGDNDYGSGLTSNKIAGRNIPNARLQSIEPIGA